MSSASFPASRRLHSCAQEFRHRCHLEPGLTLPGSPFLLLRLREYNPAASSWFVLWPSVSRNSGRTAQPAFPLPYWKLWRPRVASGRAAAAILLPPGPKFFSSKESLRAMADWAVQSPRGDTWPEIFNLRAAIAGRTSPSHLLIRRSSRNVVIRPRSVARIAVRQRRTIRGAPATVRLRHRVHL